VTVAFNLLSSVILGLLFQSSAPQAMAQLPGSPGFSEFRQILDHDHTTTSPSFQQKYFISSEYAASDVSPVIYFLSAEVSLHDHIFQEPFVSMAKALHAHFVAIENRYYGSSQPNALLTADTMRYLRFHQMLADFSELQHHLMKERKLTGPWIVIGGSFGGLLSSAYRLTHPDLVIGAIASSAPSRFVRDGTEFDHFAASKAGPHAVRRFRGLVLKPLENALKSPARMKKYKALFHAPDSLADLDFIFGVGQVADAFVQYFGADAFQKSISGPKPLASFAQTSSQMFASRLGLGLKDLTNMGIDDKRASSYRGIGTRQWAYQECVEIGLFGTPNVDPQQSLQSPLATSRADSMCREVFGIEAKPVIKAMNKSYYEPLLSTASNILFVSGSGDPVTAYAITPKSREAYGNPNIMTYMIEGGAHMADLMPSQPADSQALRDARLFEIETIKNWLTR
jgi:pimeloyl-ACP methyl ester carboxylesterase